VIDSGETKEKTRIYWGIRTGIFATVTLAAVGFDMHSFFFSVARD